jgi:hypothetical protein
VTIPGGWTFDARRTLRIQSKAPAANTIYLRAYRLLCSYVTD